MTVAIGIEVEVTGAATDELPGNSEDERVSVA